MGKVWIEESTLTSIGKSIRDVEGSAELIPPLDMPERSKALGGSGVEHTTGTATYAENISAKTIPHGLSKPPKVFFLYWNEYDKTPTIYLCGAVFTEFAAVTFYSSAQKLSYAVYNITIPGVTEPSYGHISVDGENFYIADNSRSWQAGDYTWEAYTW